MTDAYQDFLRAKVAVAASNGLPCELADVNPRLKPHQAASVVWAVRGGRRALFKAFGLGKTVVQLEIVRLILQYVGGRALIVIPLGVRDEFMRDAVEILGWSDPPKFIRSTDDAGPDGVYLTNYESVREGKIDARLFVVVSLDEAAILRGLGSSKTFRTCMALLAGDDRESGVKTDGVKYRIVATAVPSPNDYIELLAYAEFLGIMDIGTAKTRWFKRNIEKADALTLRASKEHEFWTWVATWALFVTKPSDIDPSFSDEGYVLPPLEVHWHELPSDHEHAGVEKDGQFRMFRSAAIGVQDAAREKRETLPARIAKLLELRQLDPDAHRIIWHDLEAEREAIERMLPRATYGHWHEYGDGHPVGLELFERHYSALPYRDGRERDRFAGPGYKTVLLTQDQRALFVWRKFIDDSGQQGINCAVFRNEGDLLSSDLIREAMAIAWLRWPGERLYTFVNARKVRSPNPGYCFKQAGWRECGRTKSRDLVILECLPEWVEVQAVTRRAGVAAVYGTQDLDEREALVRDFATGRLAELAGKPSMLGSGTNLQRHCAWAIYLGIGFQFHAFIQSAHRLHRFLQSKTVRLDLIYTEAERDVRRTLERKWHQHVDMVERMTKLIREFGLAHAAAASQLARSLGTVRVEASGDGYTLVNNDCVLELRNMPENSVDLIVTSIPFEAMYSYCDSYHDFGHTDGPEHFWEQMKFLTPELLRVLRPGRVCAVHVKDRITPGGINGLGFQTISRVSDRCADHFEVHGFATLARKTIVTDVVRENNQTYRLGWSEQCKDGSRMGAGLPEYLMVFRKPPTDGSNGYADVPVVKSKTEFTRPRWQFDAHGYARSSGDRLLMPQDLDGLEQSAIFQLFKKHSLERVYDFRHDVRIAEHVDRSGWLPSKFMLLQPQSWHPDVLADVVRMRTLNTSQAAKGAEQHICLARDSSVLTRERGYIPIQEVRIGEHALTHLGRWRPVAAVINTGVRPAVTIRAHGVPGLTLTPDHKLWTRSSNWVRSRDGAARATPTWMEAKDTLGAYVNLKLPTPEAQQSQDALHWWIVGRWLADGHWDTRGAVHISCGRHEIDGLRDMLGDRAGGTYDTGTAMQVRILDPHGTLRECIARCGEGAASKHLPPEAFMLPPGLAAWLLSGYLSGDGHFLEQRKRWMATSVSRVLLLGLAFLAQRAHGAIATIFEGRPARSSMIQGREVQCREEWGFSFDLPNQRRKTPFILDDGAWKRVRDISDAGECETWCLKVADDESFTAEGCIVKNCPMPIDLVERCIEQYSMPGETVLDPFAGLGTTPYCAIRLKRRGLGIELNNAYFLDAAGYCAGAARNIGMPTLFDAIDAESDARAEAA